MEGALAKSHFLEVGRFLLAVGSSLLVYAACGNATAPAQCVEGILGCPCAASSACDQGLTCRAGVCTMPGGSSGTGGSGGSGVVGALLAQSSIGPNGGVLSAPNGLRVQVPAGALTANVNLKVSQMISRPSGATGTAFDIGPNGTKFAAPVTLTIPYEPSGSTGASASRFVLATYDEPSSAWVPLPSQTSNSKTGSASAKMDHLSLKGFMDPGKSGSWSCQSSPSCPQGSVPMIFRCGAGGSGACGVEPGMYEQLCYQVGSLTQFSACAAGGADGTASPCPTGFVGTLIGASETCGYDPTNGCASVNQEEWICQKPCGNGKIDSGEDCDTDQFAAKTCRDYGYSSGSLKCMANCMIDSSGCGHTGMDADVTTMPGCGNGEIDNGEECDGPNLAGETCASLTGGWGPLGCGSNCMFDKASCNTQCIHIEGDWVVSYPDPTSGMTYLNVTITQNGCTTTTVNSTPANITGNNLVTDKNYCPPIPSEVCVNITFDAALAEPTTGYGTAKPGTKNCISQADCGMNEMCEQSHVAALMSCVGNVDVTLAKLPATSGTGGSGGGSGGSAGAGGTRTADSGVAPATAGSGGLPN
jgi:hypothetical protein